SNVLLFVHRYAVHRALPSFPTRRSSDLQHERGPKAKLIELAETTGGRAFFIDRAEDLATAYGQIETELRSRYYLAYQSDRPADKDRKSTRLNSSHDQSSYAVFCLKKTTL